MAHKNAQESLLLSRDEFRTLVLKRDKHSCVCCKVAAQDAHHIIEISTGSSTVERRSFKALVMSSNLFRCTNPMKINPLTDLPAVDNIVLEKIIENGTHKVSISKAAEGPEVAKDQIFQLIISEWPWKKNVWSFMFTKEDYASFLNLQLDFVNLIGQTDIKLTNEAARKISGL